MRVNGKLWLPFGGITSPNLVGSYANGYVYIYSSKNKVKDIRSNIIISLYNNIYKEGTYAIKIDSGTMSEVYYTEIINANIDSNRFYVDTVHTGVLKILKLDTTNFIMAGTFQFDCYNKIRNQTVKITQGRFDIRYH